ncbi:MAG: hypothetical protein GY834_12200 [Bacteroidetes bacterium]|nr:hypothetical protein [Bacteroidota bacterium]
MKIDLPRLSNVMFTRLKSDPADTPRKRDALRSIAFWLGHERAHLGPLWNFETLSKLCDRIEPKIDYKEGVRIAFSIYSRGDVILKC